LATARYPCWATDAQTLREVTLTQAPELSLRRELLVWLLHASCGWMSNTNTYRK
jgi:hypothetical protein